MPKRHAKALKCYTNTKDIENKLDVPKSKPSLEQKKSKHSQNWSNTITSEQSLKNELHIAQKTSTPQNFQNPNLVKNSQKNLVAPKNVARGSFAQGDTIKKMQFHKNLDENNEKLPKNSVKKILFYLSVKWNERTLKTSTGASNEIFNENSNIEEMQNE